MSDNAPTFRLVFFYGLEPYPNVAKGSYVSLNDTPPLLCKSRVSNFNILEMRNKWKQHVFSCFSILIEFLKSGFWLSWTFFNIETKLKELESCATSQMKAENKSFQLFF